MPAEGAFESMIAVSTHIHSSRTVKNKKQVVFRHSFYCESLSIVIDKRVSSSMPYLSTVFILHMWYNVSKVARMENSQTRLILIISGIIVVLAIVAIAVFFLNQQSATQLVPSPVPSPLESPLVTTLPSPTPAGVEAIQKAPDANPFDAETNPYKGGYKNPFE